MYLCVCVCGPDLPTFVPSSIALRLTYVHARQTTVMTSCLSIESRRWLIRSSSAEAEKMRRMQDRLWRWGGGVGQGGARIGISISWEDYWAGFRWLVPAELHGPERWTYEGRQGERDKYIEVDGWGEVRSARLWVRCLLSAEWRRMLTAETFLSELRWVSDVTENSKRGHIKRKVYKRAAWKNCAWLRAKEL